MPSPSLSPRRSFVGRLLQRLGTRPPVVAVVRLNGAIGQTGPFRSGLTLSALAGPLGRAFGSPRVKAVALAINSPGGSPAQSSLIAARIRELAVEKRKPVYAFVEDVAASGGYWLATAADEIFADQTSIVGSIGVVAAGFGFPAALARLGVERRVYTSGTRKVILDPFQPEVPADVDKLHALQQDIHIAFIEQVRARRGNRLKAAEQVLFDGEFWTGAQALELGLVDGIGHLRPVLRQRFGADVRLQVFEAPRGWLRRRAGLGSAGLAAELAGGLIGAVEERALWQRYGL